MFKNITEEIKWLQKRLEANPQSILFARLAERYLQMEEYDRAIETCTHGLDNHPGYANAHLVLAKSYMKKSDFELADQEFRKLLSIQANHLTAHKLYGDLMTHTGWANSAETSYEKVLEIDPLESHMKEPLANFGFDVQRSAEPGVNIEPVSDELDYENETVDDLFGGAEEDIATGEPEQDADSLFGTSRTGEEQLQTDQDITRLDPDVARDIEDTDADDFHLADETVEALFAHDNEQAVEEITSQEDADDQDIDDWTSSLTDDMDDADELFGSTAVTPTLSEETESMDTLPQEPSQPEVDDIFGGGGDDDMQDIFQSSDPEPQAPAEPEAYVEPKTPSAPQEPEMPSLSTMASDFKDEPQQPQLPQTDITDSADDDVFSGNDDQDDWTATLSEESDSMDVDSAGPQIASPITSDEKDKYSDILEGIFSQDMDDEEQREAETRDKLEQVISEAEETTELDESYDFDQETSESPFLGAEEEEANEIAPENMILNNADEAQLVPAQDEEVEIESSSEVPEGYVAFEEDDTSESVETGSVHMQDLDQDLDSLDNDEEEFSDFLAGLGDPKEFNDIADDAPDAQTSVTEGPSPAIEETPVAEEDDFQFPGLDDDSPSPELISEPEPHEAATPDGPDTIMVSDEDGEEKPKEKFVTPTLGEIYAAQGQYTKAIHVFEMLLEKSPDNEFYHTKLEYLRKKLSESE